MPGHVRASLEIMLLRAQLATSRRPGIKIGGEGVIDEAVIGGESRPYIG
jgi:hypothetical protein